MLEKEIEKRLTTKVKEQLHGVALKFVSPGLRGVPDRIVLVPIGRIYFVETKAPGKNLRALQAWVCNKIRKLGFKVITIDTIEKVDEFIRQVSEDAI